MKILLIKIFILFSIVFTFIFSVLFLAPGMETISAAEYKYELLRKTKSPKLILIGGSNTFIGINSEKISKELNINVANMGFTFGSGLRYMIEEIKNSINENDILVIIPEPVLFYEKFFNGQKQVIRIIFIYRPLNIYFYLQDYQLFKHMILENHIHIFEEVQKILKKKIFNPRKLFIKRKYNDKVYNKYGDCIYYLDLKALDKLIGEDERFLNKNCFSKDAINYLNGFYAKMNKKNVKVIIYSSCLPVDYYMNNKKNLDELDEWLEANIRIPKLTTIEKQTYPHEYFTDTINHLNGEGRDIRTDRLINDLKLFLHLKYDQINK